MSTVPGEESWNDAGLADPDADQPVSLVEETDQQADASGEDYHPGTARPDLSGAAAEADVIDQSFEVADAEEDPAD